MERNDIREQEELKRLLFSRELELLKHLRTSVARVERRLGDDATLARSVQRILARALREADVNEHDNVAAALAPLVIETVRDELRRREPGPGDASPPRPMGWKRAAFAIEHGLGRRPDRRGAGHASEAGLIADDAILLHTPSRDLIAEVAGQDSPNSRVEMILAANRALDTAALPEEVGRFRAVPFGQGHLHIRETPVMVLAVATRGRMTEDLRLAMEDSFFALLERWGPVLRNEGRDISKRERANLESDLAGAFIGKSDETDAPAPVEARREKPESPVLGSALLALVLIAVAGLAGYAGYDFRRGARIERQARTAVASTSEVSGWPFAIEFDRSTATLSVGGMVPTPEARDAVRRSVRAAVTDDVVLDMRTPLVPGSSDDLAALRANVDTRMSGLDDRIDAAGETDPIAELAATLMRQAVIVGEDGEPADPDQARATVLAVATALADVPERFGVRLVGYGADPGTVASRLAAGGVPPARIAAVRRERERSLGPDALPPRVEFVPVIRPETPARPGKAPARK